MPSAASQTEIRDAYRKLALVFHPDRSGAPDADMAYLNEAWHTLSDPARRASYDASLRPRSSASRRFDEAVAEEGEPQFVAFGFTQPRRWPAVALMLLGVMGVIFVFTAYAVGAGRTTVEVEPRVPLEPGKCVSIRPGAAAVEVSCTRPHYGIVHALTPLGAHCLPGTEGYFDRYSDAQVCVRVG